MKTKNRNLGAAMGRAKAANAKGDTAAVSVALQELADGLH